MKIRVSPELYAAYQAAKKAFDSAAWRPNSIAQCLAVNCAEPELLLEGNRGGGKTITLLMTYAAHVDKGYGAAWRGIIFRNTYKALEDIINQSKKVFFRIWPDATFNETERLWKFPGGETLKFSQFATPDDYNTWHGQEFPFIGWEELTNYPTDACYRSMMSCNRSSFPGVPKLIRATTNPSGPGKRWVKNRWQLPTMRNQTQTNIVDEEGYEVPNRMSLHFKFEDNLDLVRVDPKYMSRVRQSAANAEIRKAWVEGDWNSRSGGFFDDCFHPDIHMLPKFVIPKGWKLFRALDWGYNAPYSYGIYAECPETCIVELEPKREIINGIAHDIPRSMQFIRGDLIRVFEDYGWVPTNGQNKGMRLSPAAAAERFKMLEMKWGIHSLMKGGVAGVDLWNTQTDDNAPIHQFEVRKLNMDKADVSRGSRKGGLMTLVSYLENAIPKKADYGGVLPREQPALFFIEANNAQALRILSEITPDPDNPDDFRQDAEDHLVDELRYMLSRRDRSVKQHQA